MLIASTSYAIARQADQQPFQSDTGMSDLTDLRIDVVKTALNLSPEQAKYWPAIETAIRDRAQSRRQRIENLAAAMDSSQGDFDFVKALQKRAENLSERSDDLRKLATAWAPLYATLDASQKRRMRVLGVFVLHRIGEGIEARREEMRDEMDDDDMWVAPVISGMGIPARGYIR